MRILYVTPYVPSRIRTRPYHLIRGLVELGHQVTVVTAATSEEEEDEVAALREWDIEVDVFRVPKVRSAYNCLGALITGEPLQAAYAYHPLMSQRIRQRLAEESFDVVHVEHLRAARMVEAVDGVPAVYDSVDCISLLFEQAASLSPTFRSRLMTALDLARTRRYEAHLSTRYNQIVITSQRDKDALTRLAEQYLPPSTQRAPITIITNGVDTNYFRLPETNTHRDDRTVILTGKMSYHANEAGALYMANEVMPHIWATNPDVTFQIVGKDPTEIIQQLATDRRIEVLGTVPDLRPYLAQATVAVCPVPYAVGVQFKVLEAMAMEVPVVCTAAAFASLKANLREDILVANAPEAFAGLVMRLLEDPAMAKKMGINGRLYVEKHHSWEAAAEKLATIYRDICCM